MTEQYHQNRCSNILRCLASRLGYGGRTDILPGPRGLGGRKDGARGAFELVLLERFKADGHAVAGEGVAAEGKI